MNQSLRLSLILLSALLIVSLVVAQEDQESPWLLSQQQRIGGNVGVTVIDGKPYYLFTLVPELQFNKLTIGLDLNIRVGEDGKIRKEDFDETYDYLRIIRFVQWGRKREPVYARLGALDYTTLGHGFITYKYRNNASYDQRRLGVALDIDMERYGFESLYSDIGGGGVFGARAFLRPFKLSSTDVAPLLRGLEIGATIASDFHEFAIHTLEAQKSPLVVIGLDVGLPILSLPELTSTLYSDVAKFAEFGSGATVGINVNFTGLGVLAFDARYERRFLGSQFLPSYFDALYERERHHPFNDPTALSLAVLQDKSELLRRAGPSQGYFGELSLWAIGTFHVIGSYSSPAGVKNAGRLHLELETGTVLPGMILSAGYDKRNVGHAFKVDNNSLFYVQFGYKPIPFLVLSILYEWTYKERRNEQGYVIGYEPQKRVEPKAGVAFAF